MQRLVDVPGGDAKSVDLADWVELTALFSKDANTSREDLARAIRRPGSMSENRARQLAEDAFNELADREQTLKWSSSGRRKLYPFKLTHKGEVLQSNFAGIDSERNAIVYVFMLAVSRWSMDAQHRSLRGVDPTATFERMCADALMAYWGGRGKLADCLVIGTSAGRDKLKFPQFIDELCNGVREGQGWKHGAKSPGAGDGGLDLAVWRHFCDSRPGRLVAFAQCKTGVHWEEHLGKLSPRAFCASYFAQDMLLDPIPVYMVPNRVDGREWKSHMLRVRGILMDRCRITQFAAETSLSAIVECKTWLKAAFRAGGA